MNYYILRGEEKFGPYTLAQLQEYLRTGNIVETDLAQSEGMTDWVPVTQVVGNISVPLTSGPGRTDTEVALVETVPLPANMHWLVLLVLEIITRNLFNLGWALYLANWGAKTRR